MYLICGYNIIYFVLASSYSPPYGVPSPLEGLTAVFGMGTGVSPPTKHQDKIYNAYEFTTDMPDTTFRVYQCIYIR